ncbi:putative feruloyl esterase [Aspergillus affinis]|uniref:putative feruloyl esterase n=1 Tax=Aspergillus affinis TaxID=1070780 RepID=UPI0022FF2C3C|nr:putative feruloyl esterase [Aspergillus affinis]KAI9035907.1 putative feruloyl esterase [Aspergillus affinis]
MTTATSFEKCSDLSLPKFDKFKTLRTNGDVVMNHILTSDTSPISFCNFSVALTHPGDNDLVNVEIWLPLDTWNGRFLATGGGGYVAGYESNLIEPTQMGYATSSTDAGLSKGGKINPSSGEWALLEPGKINWGLVTNFAHRSIHDMTVIAKTAIREFYDTDPKYSYYSGCSTGGRMGYFSAERYPDDFDGIMANAPALHSANLSVGMEWPTAVMHDSVAVPQCVFETYQKAYIAACDALDGAADGLISDPQKCHFDTGDLASDTVICSDGTFTITTAHADAVSKITQGPRSADGKISWHGIAPGTSFSGIAVTNTTNNKTSVIPARLGIPWMKYFLTKDPNYFLENFTIADFEHMYFRSVAEFTTILGSDNPDLTEFRRANSKLLSWHGLSDRLINYQGTTWYRDTIQENMGLDPGQVDDFYRLFLAPGVDHCADGYGPVPVEPFKTLVNWVENGKAPDMLFASMVDDTNTTVTRNLCRYPEQLVYVGGDVRNAHSFVCE